MSLAVLAVLAAGVVGVVGCGGETVEPAKPVEDPTAVYWQLALNQHALNLATASEHDTFRLVATAHGLNGRPLGGHTDVTFTSTDPALVEVGADGLVRGRRHASQVPITVRLTHGAITRVDTVLVSVTTAPPPVIAQFTLEPWLFDLFGGAQPADSAKGPIESSLPPFYYPDAGLMARALDGSGEEIPDLAVWIESSDPLIADYRHAARELRLSRLGQVTFTASTWAYGMTFTATLPYTVGQRVFGDVAVQSYSPLGSTTPTYRFFPQTWTVGTGAYIWWLHEPSVPDFDVTFENPANVAADVILEQLAGASPCGAGNTSGNIAPFDTVSPIGPGLCTRYFPVPGPYRYHSTALGASGTIVVVGESEGDGVTMASAQRWSTMAQPLAPHRMSRHLWGELRWHPIGQHSIPEVPFSRSSRPAGR